MPGTTKAPVLAAVAAALVALSACVAPGPQEGLRAYERHEYEAAIASWTPSAERGDAVSQFCLGTMYEDGRGVDVDLALAHEYYLRAAAQGMAEAQLNVGRMYAQGLGVDASFERARVWFERAAEGGDALAHRNLGVMYLKGFGVAQDIEAAREHFERAADEDPFSARVLGSLHEEGLVEGAPELGEEWRIAAAAGGDVDAQAELGTRLLQRGEEIEAARWLALAAAGGDSAAQLLYGWMLQSGRGVPRDAEAAAVWIQTAATSGEPAAQASAAFALVSSAGGSPNRQQARDAAVWMRQAADAGLAVAQYNLGLMTLRGQGLQRSYRAGVRLMQEAAAQGFAPAQRQLRSLGEAVPAVRAPDVSSRR